MTGPFTVIGWSGEVLEKRIYVLKAPGAARYIDRSWKKVYPYYEEDIDYPVSALNYLSGWNEPSNTPIYSSVSELFDAEVKRADAEMDESDSKDIAAVLDSAESAATPADAIGAAGLFGGSGQFDQPGPGNDNHDTCTDSLAPLPTPTKLPSSDEIECELDTLVTDTDVEFVTAYFSKPIEPTAEQLVERGMCYML